MTATDPFARAALAARFREAAAEKIDAATEQHAAVEIRLTIDPGLVADLSVAEQTLDRIAELIAAGDVHAAGLAVAS